MVYNFKKIDDNLFKTNLDGVGREVVNYYTKETDRVLVEPNSQFDGGKIYCKKDSWIKRGDVISVSDNWYVVSQLSNLASEVFNIGVITLCDVTLVLKLNEFVYEVPAVASKYSSNANVRGIIDDSVDGQISFICGYDEAFEQEVNDSPYIVMFGKVWQVGNIMNVNHIINVRCKGVTEDKPRPDIGMSPVNLTPKVGDYQEVKFYTLNATSNDPITLDVNDKSIAEIDNSGRVHYLKKGSVNIVGRCEKTGAIYISPNITVK